MSIITVKNMHDVALGSGEGTIDPKTQFAVITEWLKQAGVEIGKQYKLASQGKTWIARCDTNRLPVVFQLLDARQSAQPAADMNYTLNFMNNSTNPGNVIVFQQDPDLGVSNVFPLAWFSQYVYPTTGTRYTWEIKYNFVWEHTGELVPGVTFSASQDPFADLQSSNQITLTYDPQHAAYNFIQQGPGPVPGTLYISQTADVPLKRASVGIGMSGVGTFVVQAEPNLDLAFTPHPKYYIAFGTYLQGEVLNMKTLTKAPEVPFPPGVYNMTAILNPDNTWTIAPTKTFNDALALTRRRLPRLFGAQAAAVDDVEAAPQPGVSADPAASPEGPAHNGHLIDSASA